MAYHLTWTYFLNHFICGWSNIIKVLKLEFWVTYRALTGNKSSLAQDDTSTSKPSPLLYGFRVLSGLFTSVLIWVPSVILDAQPNLHPSRAFVVVNLSLLLACMCAGIVLTDYVYTPVIYSLTVLVNESTGNLLIGSIKILEISYSIIGISCLIWVVIKRDFLHNFILYKCKVLMLPHKLQLKVAVQVFCFVYVLTVLSEPTFTLFIIIDEYHQPKYYPNLTEGQFRLVKFSLCSFMLYGSACISICEKIIPIITCCLITYTGEYVELVLKKLKSRLRYKHSQLYGQEWGKLNKLMEEDAIVLEELDVGTLQFDWPSTGSKRQEKERFSNKNNNNSLQIGSRIFFYKNLLKNLNELKEMKSSYERNFGIFHVLVICQNGSLLAQWIIGGLIMARQMRANGVTGFYQILSSPLVWRAIYSVIVFTITNLYMFTKCDHLNNKIKKLQNHLFKINLDLLAIKSDTGSQNHRRDFDLLWSLYDQVKRVSEEINFKLMGNTYYTKKCLLMVYSRELSAVLLYMQIVDLTNT